MHLGIHDSAFFLFIFRRMICINFKSIPGITESSLYSWDLWMGICWCFLFSFCCGCCCCGCQSPSCPVHLEKLPLGVDDEALSVIHTGPLAVHVRLAVWWRWSTCSKRAPHWCWVRSATQEWLHAPPLFPWYFFSHLVSPKYFLWVFLLLSYLCNHGILLFIYQA